LLTDGNGIPIGIEVAGANRHDSQLVEATLKSIPIERPKVRPYHRQHLCLDAGYVGDKVAAIGKKFDYTLHVRPRGEEKKLLQEPTKFRARRWVVERTHSWMNRYRRILVRWEKYAENYLAMLHLSFALTTFGKSRGKFRH
jgi:transposase